MDTSFHNSMNKLLVFSLLFEEKSHYFCLEITKICQKLLMISGMSSDLFLFLLRRHLWDVFRPFYGPLGALPGPLWTLWGSSRALVDPSGLLQELRHSSAGRSYFSALLFWSAAPLQGRGGEATRALHQD